MKKFSLTRSWLLGLLAVVAIGSLSIFSKWWLSGSETKLLGATTDSGVLKFEVADMVQVNRPFQMVVSVDSGANHINAAGVYLRFDPNFMQLTQLDTRSSFCQFYPEKKYDNQLGSIQLACGSPHPGMSGTNTLMILEFMPLKVGTTTLYTDTKSQLLLSDGKGTNILNTYPTEQIHIGNLP